MSQQPNNSSAAERVARLEGYLAADPDNLTLLTELVQTAMRGGLIDLAQRHLEHALSLRSADPVLLSWRGHVLLARGEYEQAATLFGTLLAATPQADLAYNLAYALSKLERHQQAADALLPYAGEAPAPAMVLLLRSLHHAGQAAMASQLATEHESRLAADELFLAAASLAHIDGGDMHAALRLSDLALAGGVRPLEAVVANATVRLGEGDDAGARTLFEEAVALHPADGRSWSGLGLASLLARDLPKAAEQLSTALRFMPSHIGTWHALAWCHLFAGDLDQSEQAFRQALALDRNFGDSHGGIAVVAAFRGDRVAAQASIDRALGLDRTSLSARYAQMALAGQLDDPDRFRALARKLMSTHRTPLGADVTNLMARQ